MVQHDMPARLVSEQLYSYSLDLSKAVVVIAFNDSRSKKLLHALRLCTELATSTTRDELRGRTTATIEMPLATKEKWASTLDLANTVKNWNGSAIQTVGIPYRTLGIFNREIQKVWSCHSAFVSSGRAVGYCLGLESPDGEKSTFGCRLLLGACIRPHGYRKRMPEWFEFAAPAGDGSWEVSKQKVLETILMESAFNPCTACSVFDWQRVVQELSELPGRFECEDSPFFEVLRDEADGPRAIRRSHVIASWSMNTDPIVKECVRQIREATQDSEALYRVVVDACEHRSPEFLWRSRKG